MRLMMTVATVVANRAGIGNNASRSRQATTDTDSAEYNVAFEWVIKHKAF